MIIATRDAKGPAFKSGVLAAAYSKDLINWNFSLAVRDVVEMGLTNKNSLNICIDLMEKAWELFFNKEDQILQKNIINNNDLFANPVDLADNNIPNGNSIYLFICNKLNNITNKKSWKEKIDTLSKSFHSYINFNYTQMFSYLKVLDICENNITLTFHGKMNEMEKVKNNILKKFMGNISIIYKENEDDFFAVMCKNQTCSEKLKNFEDINNYIETRI